MYGFCGNNGVNRWDYLGQKTITYYSYEKRIEGSTEHVDAWGVKTYTPNEVDYKVEHTIEVPDENDSFFDRLANPHIQDQTLTLFDKNTGSSLQFFIPNSTGDLMGSASSAMANTVANFDYAANASAAQAAAAAAHSNSTAGVHAGYSDGIPDDYDIRRIGAPDPNIRIAKDGLIINRGRPMDSVVFTAPDGQKFFAPAGTDFNAAYAAGVANGTGKIAMNNAVGHWGTFDFQRNGGAGDLGGGNNIFFTQYTNASNYAVGVYLNGAGYSLHDALDLAGGFANWFSSNAGAPAQARWQTQGWWAGQHGAPNGKGP